MLLYFVLAFQEVARTMICGGWMIAQDARAREAASDVTSAMLGSPGASLTSGRTVGYEGQFVCKVITIR